MNKLIGLFLTALLLAALPQGDSLGRGFGGFRGGGFGGGGFGGGGFGGGWGGGARDTGSGGGWGGGFRDMDSGGSWGGGFRDSGFDSGGSSGFRAGGFRDDSAGGSRQQTYHQDTVRSSSDDSWRSREPDDSRWGGDTAGASRSQLNSFLGMPSDAGLSHFAPPPADRSIEGTRVTAGRVEGPYGGSAGYVSRTHVDYVSPDVRSSQASAVRTSFTGYNAFSPSWYGRHPTAWTAAGLSGSVWAPGSWSDAADWIGCDSTPVDYDYGSSVLYQGNDVYVEGQPVGSASQYSAQAGSLAASGAPAQDDQSQWMSLGVFGMVQGKQTDPTMIFQLAVNRQGIIRGNYYSPISGTTLPVKGAVDKSTQRAAWTIGDNKDTVFDTGLYNLTQDQAPALVHSGDNRTQEWLMVRLKGKAAAQGDS